MIVPPPRNIDALKQRMMRTDMEHVDFYLGFKQLQMCLFAHTRARVHTCAVEAQPLDGAEPRISFLHPMISPRVFVQYSHETPEHKDAVWELVENLRRAGIDARSDHDVSAPPEGWPRWMIKQIEGAKFVLVICSKTNAKRVAGKEKAGKGQGATFEGLLLHQFINDKDSKNSKFIPILLSGSGETRVPALLKPFTHYRLPRDWEPLLRHLTNQPERVPPPLGQIPVLPSRGASPKPARAEVQAPGASPKSVRAKAGAPQPTPPIMEKSPETSEVAEKLDECLVEFDRAAKQEEWKQVARWYQTWRIWFEHALPGETSRIRALVQKEPAEGQFIGRGRNKFFLNEAFENAVADVRAEVMALIKKHVPARSRRRSIRPAQHPEP